MMRKIVMLSALLVVAAPLSLQAQTAPMGAGANPSTPPPAGTTAGEKDHRVLSGNPATDPGSMPATPPSTPPATRPAIPPAPGTPSSDPTSSKAYGGWDPATASSGAQAPGRTSPHGASDTPTGTTSR